MKLTSYQKTAQVMLSLSPKDAANVLRSLSEEELLFVGESILKHAKTAERKSAEAATAKDAQADEKDPTKAKTKEGQSFLRIAVDDFSELEVVKALYKIAFGEKRAIELIQKLFRRNLVNRFSFLSNHSPQHLFLALRNESVSLISLILGALKAKVAAEVIRLFDQEKRRDIITAISAHQQPAPQVIATIETMLRTKLNEMARVEQDKEALDGEHTLYLILDKLTPEAQDEILDNFTDKEMKERLEYKLFSWSSVELVYQKDIEQILQDFNNEELAHLILIDGIDATEVLATILSENRLSLIEDELELMKKDIVVQSTEMRNAIEVKKRFFSRIKELVRDTEHI